MSVENAYERFLNVVAQSRNMSPAEVDDIAQGRVWIATQAKELGLVDKLGDKDAAISAAAEMASLKQYDVKLIEQQLTPREQLLNSLLSSSMVSTLIDKQTPASANLGATMQVNSLLKQVEQQVQSLQNYNDPDGIYAKCLVCRVSN
tara:strand:- start:1303 stop:1743 length:441 start_codon:yes stop_codon:yes gene_type:complete